MNVRNDKLTKGMLDNLAKRIDELEEIINLCDERFDRDVLENCDSELQEICAILEKHLSTTKEN